MAADNRNFVNKFANEGGGDILCEDKRFEELKSATAKTSSQISTTTDYIPLQDTDGNLVKINPASFEEAVRNVLGGLLANNDKGTTISGVPALSGSGASLDFGSVTPANLASVLGADMGYYKIIPWASVDQGYVRIKTTGGTSGRFLLNVGVSGTPATGTKDPIGVLVSNGSGKFYCSSGDIYMKISANEADIIIAPTNSIDYSFGFVFGSAKCTYASIINRSGFDISGYTKL